MKITSLTLRPKNLFLVFVQGLLLAKPAHACTQLLNQSTQEVYQALLFPENDSIIRECLALIASNGANETIQGAIAASLATDIQQAAQEPIRTHIETWVKKEQDTVVLDKLATAFGMDCQPTSCILRESAFTGIKTALLEKATQKKWLNYRLSTMVSKGIGFDTVLEANLVSNDPYEKVLIDAFKAYSVEYFKSNVSQDNANRFKSWTNLLKTSVVENYGKFATKSIPIASDILPLMQDFLILKSITDDAVRIAKKHKVSILKNNRKRPSKPRVDVIPA